MKPILIETNENSSMNTYTGVGGDECVVLQKFDEMFRNELHCDKIDKFICPLQRLGLLGRGSSSVVYKSLYLPTNTIVAEKVVMVSDPQKRIQICRELELLKDKINSNEFRKSNELDDNNILNELLPSDLLVQLVAVVPNPVDNCISLCLEWMSGGSLEDLMKKINKSELTLSDSPLFRNIPNSPDERARFEMCKRAGSLDEGALKSVAVQILKSLSFLHNKRIIHRDLKPGNILVDDAGHVKISDFGLSRELRIGHTLTASFIGTYQYMAPERITGGESYSFPSDIWSFGVTLLTLALGHHPYQKKPRPSKKHVDVTVEVRNRGDKAVPTSVFCNVDKNFVKIEKRPLSKEKTKSDLKVSVKSKPTISPDNISAGCTLNSDENSINSGVSEDKNCAGNNNYWALLHSIVSESMPSPSRDCYSAECIDFIMSMCQKKPEERPTCKELLLHPFVQIESEPNVCTASRNAIATPCKQNVVSVVHTPIMTPDCNSYRVGTTPQTVSRKKVNPATLQKAQECRNRCATSPMTTCDFDKSKTIVNRCVSSAVLPQMRRTPSTTSKLIKKPVEMTVTPLKLPSIFVKPSYSR